LADRHLDHAKVQVEFVVPVVVEKEYLTVGKGRLVEVVSIKYIYIAKELEFGFLGPGIFVLG
jgi:hypothetical protein